MATINVTWTVKQQIFAVGVIPGNWQVELLRSDGTTPVVSPVIVNTPSNIAVFQNISTGNYITRVHRMSNAMQSLASAESAFAVSATPIDVPDIVNIHIS